MHQGDALLSQYRSKRLDTAGCSIWSWETSGKRKGPNYLVEYEQAKARSCLGSLSRQGSGLYVYIIAFAGSQGSADACQLGWILRSVRGTGKGIAAECSE